MLGVGSICIAAIDTASYAATVSSYSCLEFPRKKSAECQIHLSGIVKSEDVLYFNLGAESDIASFKSVELGRTGYVFARQFFALDIPRTYSLAPLAGIESPTLSVRCMTGQVADGLAEQSKRIVRIISADEAPAIWVNGMLHGFLVPVIFVLLSVTLGTLALAGARRPINDGWSWNPNIIRLFFFVLLFYEISMSRLPRLLTPWLISLEVYEAFHGVLVSCVRWCLADLVLTSRFLDLGDPHELPKHKSNFQAFRIVLFFTFVICSAAANIVHPLPLYIVVLLQTSLAVVALVLRVMSTDFSYIRTRALLGSQLFAVVLILAVFACVRDAVVFSFWPTGNNYFVAKYIYLLTFAAWYYRALEFSKCNNLGAQISATARQALQSGTSAHEKLSELCKILYATWGSDSVQIIAIRKNETLVLACAPFELPMKQTPQPSTSAMSILLDRKIPTLIHYDLSEGSRQPTVLFMIPILQKSQLVGGIEFWSKAANFPSPQKLQILRAAAITLQLEALSAISESITERQLDQIQDLMRGMSGIVLEHSNSWGRILTSTHPVRRIILSADGIKSTHVDQMGRSSPGLWALSRSYKRDLYAHWFAVKETFELLTRDIRGDDYWLFSPVRFQNPFLRELGAERVVLIAALLIEEQCRILCNTPRYLPLGRTGAHVAVGSDVIELLEVGTANTLSRDIHGNGISRLHRIRAVSSPGAVLVDCDDPLLQKAAFDERFFISGRFPIGDTDENIPDLHEVPSVGQIFSLNYSPELQGLRTSSYEIARQSPYRDT